MSNPIGPNLSPSRDMRTKDRKIVYLACPYTHPDYNIRKQRFVEATKVAAALIRRGYIVFSPVTMTHPIDSILAGQRGTLGSDYWVQFDKAFMDACSEMLILKIDGWTESQGIKHEIEYFRSHGKPIRLVDCDAQILLAPDYLTSKDKVL